MSEWLDGPERRYARSGGLRHSLRSAVQRLEGDFARAVIAHTVWIEGELSRRLKRAEIL